MKVLHIQKPPQRHSTVPYLYRWSCSCGVWGIAADLLSAQAATAEHISSEEPFPEDFLPPDPDSEAAKRSQ